jgi:hypothetical protein
MNARLIQPLGPWDPPEEPCFSERIIRRLLRDGEVHSSCIPGVDKDAARRTLRRLQDAGEIVVSRREQVQGGTRTYFRRAG